VREVHGRPVASTPRSTFFVWSIESGSYWPKFPPFDAGVGGSSKLSSSLEDIFSHIRDQRKTIYTKRGPIVFQK